MSTSVLLNHLRYQTPSVPLATLTAALAHHLAVDQTSPTPLAAAAVSSPFFLAYPHPHERLQGLVTAFRHAVHLKHQALLNVCEEGWSFSSAVFSKSTHAALREWVRNVLRGLQGGLAIIKLACCTGLLLGLRQLGDTMKISQVEDEVVISLAEVLDNYTSGTGAWEKEFWPDLDETTLSLTVILASQSLPHVPPAKLKALPLSLLVRLLVTTISSAFDQGNLMSALPTSLPGPSLSIDPSSLFSQKIKRTSSTPTMQSMAALSRLTAVLLGVLIDSPKGGLTEALESLETFRNIARRVERDWIASKLSAIQNEEDIVQDTRELSKSIWMLLKTLLFTIIMIADGTLDSVVYARPQPSSFTPNTSDPQPILPCMVAQSVLRTLSHLSFVVSQFGGVTATGPRNEPGFTELRKVFYLAIDVLCSGECLEFMQGQENRCEAFARELVDGLRCFNENREAAESLKHGKAAYTLACIEQLVPILQEPCLKNYAWNTCVPYLSDPSHRGTYESAHSVVLAIFASHAQRHPNYNHLPAEHSIPLDAGPISFVHHMVPFYSQCLIENSKDGHLSTSQLRLAYAALVRGACSNNGTVPQHLAGNKLAWYCIMVLTDAIRELSANSAATSSKDEAKRDWLHRLHLTLISTVPSLPLPLMMRVLGDILDILKGLHKASEEGVNDGDVGAEGKLRKELVEALFDELLEGVGDREKEAAMRWWYEHREELEEVIGDTGSGKHSGVLSRL